MEIIPIIMAGGSGSRLWPLSRQQYPKQFLSLYGNATMLQDTVSRLKSLNHANPIVICNEEHRFSVAEQLAEANLKYDKIILEPEGRNTAPAIALAAFKAINNGSDPLLLVLAADHVIKSPQAFVATISKARLLAEDNKLVTFGIVPTSPETGYGYINRGNELKNNSAYEISEFVEKPSLDKARHYVESQQFYWNSGMFLFKASKYLSELQKFRPDIYTACKAAMDNPSSDLDFLRVDKEAFLKSPSDSMDYAVMEQTTQGVVIPLDCGWSDVGSWSSLWDITEKDSSGNASRGDVINIDSQNSYIYAQDKLITTIGLEDTVVIETKDAVLVAKKDQVQKVKEVVESLKSRERSEWQHHRDVYRPWGKYDSIDKGERFQVKRITVKPGEKLSSQMHHHRAEHWVVVSGTAKVMKDGMETLLSENQSTYIPLGAIHSLENPGKIPLELIEIQSGSYLSEDDIVRFEDRYGRCKT